MLINQGAEGVRESDYPDTWTQGSLRFALTYQFEPGADADGVTVHIPLSVLNQARQDGFDWQVPGLREELVTALIKSLPKQLRRNFVPAPDHAKLVLSRVSPADGPLLDVLAGELEDLRGVAVPLAEWKPSAVPDHLRITFRVVDEKGRKLGEGKELAALKHRLSGRVRETISRAADGIERTGLTKPAFGELPQVWRGDQMQAYPALVDEGDTVAVRMLDTAVEQRQQMWSGTRKMLRLNLPSPMKFITRSLSNQSKLVLGRNPHGGVGALLEDCVNCAVDKLIADNGGPVWDEAGFGVLLEKVRGGLNPTVLDVLSEVEQILLAANEVEARLADTRGPAESLADIRRQLTKLVYPGFVTATGLTRLPNLVRYLRAIERRLEKLRTGADRDIELLRDVQWLTGEYQRAVEALPPGVAPGPELVEVRWMIEELRVSYFAQTLGTAFPVSTKRVLRALDAAA
jgi:ATP-dependent helicase HrpA